MDWRALALMAAGAIGAVTALIHGAIIQRVLVRPLAALGPERIPSSAVRRLIPALLHSSTFAWFAGGVALIASASLLDRMSAMAVGALVGSLFLFGAIFNCWATRGRHPGWLLMAAAVVLIVLAASPSGT